MRALLYSRWLVLSLVMFFGLVAQSSAQIGISVSFGPPALPVYEQPICPSDGYLWTPGYWAYGDDDYYWVPGTWIEPPQVGYLWTPGYWGWGGNAFLFHEGYWGSQIGFYGGISYGFGYFGHGYEGGRWDGGHFFYNRTVNNVNVTNIHNTYNTTIVNNNTTINRVSYNGGTGGIEARASVQEEAAARETHVGPVAAQTEHVRMAASNQQLRASVNHGKPAIAATSRPGQFTGGGAVAAREAGGTYQPRTNQPAAAAHGEMTKTDRPPTASAIHPKDVPAYTKPAPANTGNPKVDQKYQQQQDKMYAKQDQERQKLQQKQDQQHQQAARQQASEAKTQQIEQQHQKQTQELVQRHTQQQQSLQQHQQQHAPQPQHEPAPHKP